MSRWWDDREDTPRVQWIASAWRGFKILSLVYLGIGALYTAWTVVTWHGSDPPFLWGLAMSFFLWPLVMWFHFMAWLWWS